MLRGLSDVRSGARAEWRSLRGPRRSVLVMVLLGLPIIYPTIISFLYLRRQADERPALVIDADNSEVTRALTLALDATREIQIVGRPSSLEEGFQALRRQQAELLVYLPADMAVRLARREQAHLKLWASTTNIYTYGLSYPALHDVVLSTATRLAAGSLVRKGFPPSQVRRRLPAIVADVRQVFIPTGTYAVFILPGLMLVVLQQVVLVSLTFSVGWQREEGALPSTRRRFADLFGRALVHQLFHLLGAALIVFVLFPLFGWPLLRPLVAFGIMSALTFSLIPAAIAAAAVAPDRYLAFQLLMFFSAPVFMMSGFSYPLEQMPGYVQAIAWLFPTTPALHLLRAAVTGAAWSGLVVPAVRLSVQVAGWTAVAVLVCHFAPRRIRRSPEERT